MRFTVVVLTLMLSACDGPMGPIAGGKLEGAQQPWPDNWQFTENTENVLLETNPTDPYSVTLWGVAIGETFYVVAARPKSRPVASDNGWRMSPVSLTTVGPMTGHPCCFPSMVTCMFISWRANTSVS